MFLGCKPRRQTALSQKKLKLFPFCVRIGVPKIKNAAFFGQAKRITPNTSPIIYVMKNILGDLGIIMKNSFDKFSVGVIIGIAYFGILAILILKFLH